jgi:predicted ABC-type ATPase
MTLRIIIIAGPNGVGKTTFARAFLPQEAHCQRFINADLIAAGLSPFAPEIMAIKAGRLMLQELASCVAQQQSFAFETTLSGLAYLRHIHKWQQQGYKVSLYFLSLPTVDLAIERVAFRVQQGGHHIPEDVIRRRFAAGRKNFEQQYSPIVNDWALYDNAGEEPLLIEWGEN